jgi:hypothetical protein
MKKPPYVTSVSARFIVHFFHYMFRPLIGGHLLVVSNTKNTQSQLLHTSTDPLSQCIRASAVVT